MGGAGVAVDIQGDAVRMKGEPMNFAHKTIGQALVKALLQEYPMDATHNPAHQEMNYRVDPPVLEDVPEVLYIEGCVELDVAKLAAVIAQHLDNNGVTWNG